MEKSRKKSFLLFTMRWDKFPIVSMSKTMIIHDAKKIYENNAALFSPFSLNMDIYPFIFQLLCNYNHHSEPAVHVGCVWKYAKDTLSDNTSPTVRSKVTLHLRVTHTHGSCRDLQQENWTCVLSSHHFFRLFVPSTYSWLWVMIVVIKITFYIF